jgi:hypothetical protein
MKVTIVEYGDIKAGKTIKVPEDLAQTMIDEGQAVAFIETIAKEDVKSNKRNRNKGGSDNLDAGEELVEGNEE